jgi:hypothetical protein
MLTDYATRFGVPSCRRQQPGPVWTCPVDAPYFELVPRVPRVWLAVALITGSDSV